MRKFINNIFKIIGTITIILIIFKLLNLITLNWILVFALWYPILIIYLSAYLINLEMKLIEYIIEKRKE